MDRNQEQNDELIDLGAASVETKGATHGVPTDDNNLFIKSMAIGLADD